MGVRGDDVDGVTAARNIKYKNGDIDINIEVDIHIRSLLFSKPILCLWR